MRRFAPTWPAGAFQNHRILCPGTGGRFALDQLDDLDRNRWTNWTGTSGRFPPDQVDDFIGIRIRTVQRDLELLQSLGECIDYDCASNTYTIPDWWTSIIAP